MAKTIMTLSKNTIDGKDLLEGTEKLNIDKNAAKIRIAYSKYLGE